MKTNHKPFKMARSSLFSLLIILTTLPLSAAFVSGGSENNLSPEEERLRAASFTQLPLIPQGEADVFDEASVGSFIYREFEYQIFKTKSSAAGSTAIKTYYVHRHAVIDESSFQNAFNRAISDAEAKSGVGKAEFTVDFEFNKEMEDMAVAEATKMTGAPAVVKPMPMKAFMLFAGNDFRSHVLHVWPDPPTPSLAGPMPVKLKVVVMRTKEELAFIRSAPLFIRCWSKGFSVTQNLVSYDARSANLNKMSKVLRGKDDMKSSYKASHIEAGGGFSMGLFGFGGSGATDQMDSNGKAWRTRGDVRKLAATAMFETRANSWIEDADLKSKCTDDAEKMATAIMQVLTESLGTQQKAVCHFTVDPSGAVTLGSGVPPSLTSEGKNALSTSIKDTLSQIPKPEAKADSVESAAPAKPGSSGPSALVSLGMSYGRKTGSETYTGTIELLECSELKAEFNVNFKSECNFARRMPISTDVPVAFWVIENQPVPPKVVVETNSYTFPPSGQFSTRPPNYTRVSGGDNDVYSSGPNQFIPGVPPPKRTRSAVDYSFALVDTHTIEFKLRHTVTEIGGNHTSLQSVWHRETMKLPSDVRDAKWRISAFTPIEISRAYMVLGQEHSTFHWGQHRASDVTIDSIRLPHLSNIDHRIDGDDSNDYNDVRFRARREPLAIGLVREVNVPQQVAKKRYHYR